MPHPKSQTKNKRSFTGCYTCRQRKVKCDNARPVCQRCIKSKFECQGYDVKLRWSAPLTVGRGELVKIGDMGDEEELNFKRRNIEFMKFKKLYKFDQDLDDDIEFCNIENLQRKGRDRVSYGPFTIYSMNYFQTRPRQLIIPEFNIQANHSDIRSTTPYVKVWIDKTFTKSAMVTYSFLINKVMMEPTPDMNKVIFAKYFEVHNRGSIEMLLLRYRSKNVQLQQKGIVMNEVFNILIRFFVENIHLMMPITFKGNIYETLVIPMIYQFIGQVMTTVEDSFVLSIKRTIIKQVLCLASFNMYENRDDDIGYLKISIKLRQEIMDEVSLLIVKLTDHDNEFLRNQCMDELLQSYEIKNVVLVFILMIKIDFFVQILENFSIWFKTMDKLIEFLNNYNDSILNNLTFNNVNEKLTLDKFSNLKKLIKLYRFIKIFYFSTAKIDFNNYEFKNDDEEVDEFIDYDFLKGDFIFDDGFSKIDDYLDMLLKKPHLMDPGSITVDFTANERLESLSSSSSNSEKFVMIDIPRPDNDTVFIGDVEDDVNKFSSMEYMYGLPLSLLELFNKIITLTNHKNYFTRRNLFPKNYQKLCSDLEDDLMNWKLTWKLIDDQGCYKSTFHEILYHNILSFYNSLCIYFERIIKESDPSILQNYVRNSLGHLVKLTRVNDINLKISPLFWSFFISSCDAIELEIQLQIAQISTKFLGNNWISKQIIMEVWKQRQEGFHKVCWLDIVKSWDCDVLLLC